MLFKSFFWAGFECAACHNMHGEWIDQVQATGHERWVDKDYAMVAAAGLKTVREGARWPLIDQAKGYDFSSLAPFLRAAQRHDVQVVWDLFHYGYPDHLDIFSDEFVDRFADYCYAVAGHICDKLGGTPVFTPVNEPSYFSWAASDAQRFRPYAPERGWELKVQLARAAIKGAEAIWAACPKARIVQADPVCRIVPPLDCPDRQCECDNFNENVVYEAMDMVSGRLLPELGGSPKHLGIVGINYYWTNQFELGQDEHPLAMDDQRHCSLGDIVRNTYNRYKCDVVISETAHTGEMRASWLRSVADEVETLLDDGIPIRGVCLYPVLGMPEWHDQSVWARMGLWDVHEETMERKLHRPVYDALREAQERLEPVVLEQYAGVEARRR